MGIQQPQQTIRILFRAYHTSNKQSTPNTAKMLYSGYYNLHVANQHNAQQAYSRNGSAANTSRRNSVKSEASSSSQEAQKQQPERRRSSIKRALDMLRPTEEPVTVEGIYSPVFKQDKKSNKKEKKAKKEKMVWNMSRAQYELISA